MNRKIPRIVRKSVALQGDQKARMVIAGDREIELETGKPGATQELAITGPRIQIIAVSVQPFLSRVPMGQAAWQNSDERDAGVRIVISDKVPGTVSIFDSYVQITAWTQKPKSVSQRPLLQFFP